MPKHKIKALTLHRPWDWAIINAGKDVENRDWPCYLKPGDYIALHAGKTFDHAGYRFIADMCAEVRAPWPPTDEQHRAGFIYGIAQFGGNVQDSDSPWFFGDYGWILKNVVAIEPVACRGAQKLFDLPADVLAQVRRNYKAATDPHHISQVMIYESIDAVEDFDYPTIPTEQERADRAARMAAMPSTPYVGIIDDSEPWPLTPAERLRAIREGRIAPEPRSAEDWGAL